MAQGNVGLLGKSEGKWVWWCGPLKAGRFIWPMDGQNEIGALFGISEGNLDMSWVGTKIV